MYEAVRKVSPETLLNAINATEDFGSSTGGFISDFLKFGGGKYTDVISFHPYRSSQDDSAVSAMEGIKGFREIMKQYGVDLKLAETECFYLIPNPNPNQPEYSWNIFGPAAVARRIMIDMGEGLLFSIPLEVYHLHQAQAGNQECHREYFLKVPNANFAAHNAAGYFLNGAENGCRIGLPGNELCYTFEKNGRKFSSIWCISGKSNMTLNLPAGVSCKVYDFYGNLIKKADKILSRTLDRDPLFIEWSDDADVKAIHSSGDYAPLQAVQFHGVQQMDGGIGLLITNRTSKPISGVAGLNSKYLKSVKTKFSGIQPHANSCIVIPVKIKPDAPETFPLTAVCIVDGKFLSQKVTLKQVPVLKPDQEYPLGPHKFKLEKKGNKLLFTGFLSSRNPKVSPNPKTPWEGDSIEIFCDYAPERYNPNKLDVFNDFCVQFCIPADKDGSPVPLVLRSRQNFELKNVNVVRSADGAQVTALLPYRKGMHFNIHFNAEGKTAVLNGKRNFKDRSGYAVIAE